ncbi:aminomethyl transferase family protein [Streptomyces sp. NPDC056161]|uniref:aminomethyl transferase family protein n=1 Tax=Streptomyces sp. NPDC056161 TaxID=3345732 RepID=UPI0035E33CB2
MSSKSLEDKIQQAGNPARMLRDAPVGVYAFPFRGEYSNWRDEQEAWNRTAVLFDQSFHMTDVYFEGPDARRLMSDVALNSFRTFGKNKAKQLIVCNQDGRFIGDAILFGLEDDKFQLVGTPLAPNWVAYQAETGGYDVEVTRDERSVDNGGKRRTYRYQLQGPNALKIIEKAHGGPIDRIRFFNIGEFTLAGRPVRALNHTMIGIPGQEMTGLEMFGPADDAPAVLDALLTAGAEFGLRQGGSIAYPTTGVESGWAGLCVPAIYTGERMKPYREWLRAEGFEASASLGGSFTSDDIEDYYLTPWDLGYDRVLKFDHDFIGRAALEELADQPHRKEVWLRWNDDDVARAIAASLFGGKDRAKYLDIPYSVYATFQYDKVLIGDRPAGVSFKGAYTVNIGGWASVASIDEADAQDGTEVTLVWGEENGGSAKPSVERHVQTPIRATVHTTPLV